jgi:hypothetical protein
LTSENQFEFGKGWWAIKTVIVHVVNALKNNRRIDKNELVLEIVSAAQSKHTKRIQTLILLFFGNPDVYGNSKVERISLFHLKCNEAFANIHFLNAYFMHNRSMESFNV